MKKDDQEILKEVQKNSSMAINAIETVSQMVHNFVFCNTKQGNRPITTRAGGGVSCQ